MKTKLIRCLDHPRYRGAGKPRGNCLACWRVWLNYADGSRWRNLNSWEIAQIMGLLGGHI